MRTSLAVPVPDASVPDGGLARLGYLSLLIVVAAMADSGCRPAPTVVDGGVRPDAARADGAEPDGGEEVDADFVEETCTPDPDDTFCPMYAAAFCEGHFDCCRVADDPGVRYATMELCVQRTLCICTAGRTGAAFDSGRVTFDAAGAAALLTRVTDAGATCAVLSPEDLEVGVAYAGTLPEGGDCSPTGADYSNLFACGPGLYCYVTSFGDETMPPAADCRRYRAEGEECDASGMTCAPGLYCGDGATIDDPGICRALLAASAPCDNDFQCASDYCDDLAGNTCVMPDQDDTWCVDASLEP